MKFEFTIQQYQADTVDNTVAVFGYLPINDYRNPLIASAMKTLGYVNMFNRGVGQVQADLKENGNPPTEFIVNLLTAFRVNVFDVVKDVADSVVDTGASQVVLSSVPSLSQAVPSLSQVLSQVCPKLEKEYYASVIKVLAGLSKESQSLRILMQLTGDTNRGRFKNNVLSHILEAGFVEPTITNNPNSPKQRYILTEKGKEMMNAYEI